MLDLEVRGFHHGIVSRCSPEQIGDQTGIEHRRAEGPPYRDAADLDGFIGELKVAGLD